MAQGAVFDSEHLPQDGEEVETLLAHADAAMYKAKEAGGNRFEFYDRAMTKAAFQRIALEGTLHKALDRGAHPEVEITESALLRNVDEIVNKLRTLRVEPAVGLLSSLDDRPVQRYRTGSGARPRNLAKVASAHQSPRRAA